MIPVVIQLVEPAHWCDLEDGVGVGGGGCTVHTHPWICPFVFSGLWPGHTALKCLFQRKKGKQPPFLNLHLVLCNRFSLNAGHRMGKGFAASYWEVRRKVTEWCTREWQVPEVWVCGPHGCMWTGCLGSRTLGDFSWCPLNPPPSQILVGSMGVTWFPLLKLKEKTLNWMQSIWALKNFQDQWWC